MENGEALKLAFGVMVPVIGWLVLNNLQQDKKLISIEKTLENVEEKLDKLTEKLNLFLKTEIDTLKDLAKSKTS